MLDDLPAPRDAPNIYLRWLVVLFGRGYWFAILMIIALVPLAWLKATLLPDPWWERLGESIKAGSITMPPSPGPYVEVLRGLFAFASAFFQTVAAGFIAFLTRQVLNGEAFDLAGAAALIWKRIPALFGITVLWFAVGEVLKDAAIVLGVYTNLQFPISMMALYVIFGLVLFGSSWSMLCIVFARTGILKAFLSGLVGVWNPIARAAPIALTFIFAQAIDSIARFSVYDTALAHSASQGVTSLASSAIDAVFTAFLTVLITLYYLELGERSCLVELPG